MLRRIGVLVSGSELQQAPDQSHCGPNSPRQVCFSRDKKENVRKRDPVIENFGLWCRESD